MGDEQWKYMDEVREWGGVENLGETFSMNLFESSVHKPRIFMNYKKNGGVKCLLWFFLSFF